MIGDTPQDSITIPRPSPSMIAISAPHIPLTQSSLPLSSILSLLFLSLSFLSPSLITLFPPLFVSLSLISLSLITLSLSLSQSTPFLSVCLPLIPPALCPVSQLPLVLSESEGLGVFVMRRPGQIYLPCQPYDAV